MPTNLELKIRLNNPDKILKTVRAINAEYKGGMNQVDVYYKNSNFRLKLRLENGTQVLIKYSRNEGTGNRWSDYQLISLEKNDARDFLNDIFGEEVVVEKIRKYYLYDNTRIHIDEVKGLGSFLELETLVVKGKKDAEKRFHQLINLLSLDKKDEIRNSYRDLLLEKMGK